MLVVTYLACWLLHTWHAACRHPASWLSHTWHAVKTPVMIIVKTPGMLVVPYLARWLSKTPGMLVVRHQAYLWILVIHYTWPAVKVTFLALAGKTPSLGGLVS
jgi:hypothetical protein